MLHPAMTRNDVIVFIFICSYATSKQKAIFIATTLCREKNDAVEEGARVLGTHVGRLSVAQARLVYQVQHGLSVIIRYYQMDWISRL